MAEKHKLLYSDTLIKIYGDNNNMNNYIIVVVTYIHCKYGVSQKTNKDLC